MRLRRRTEEGAENSKDFSEGYDSGHSDQKEGTSKLKEGIPKIKTVLKKEIKETKEE